LPSKSRLKFSFQVTEPGSLASVRQLPKKTFRSYVLANLKGHHLTAMPVLYRLA
jgi:hypothetical protein